MATSASNPPPSPPPISTPASTSPSGPSSPSSSPWASPRLTGCKPSTPPASASHRSLLQSNQPQISHRSPHKEVSANARPIAQHPRPPPRVHPHPHRRPHHAGRAPPAPRQLPQAARLARHHRRNSSRIRQLVPAPVRHPPCLLLLHPGRRLLEFLPHPHRRRRPRHPPQFARLLRGQRHPRRRVLRSHPLRSHRHDADDLLRRAADGLHRARDLLHLHLHHGRLPQGPGHRLRVLHQVLPPRLLRHRLLPLRHRLGLRSHRVYIHLCDRPRRGHHRNP